MPRQIASPGNGYPLSRDLSARLVDVNGLMPLGRPTRKHPKSQIRKLEASITEFGLASPIVINDARQVIAGWGLVLAAKNLGLEKIPAITITDLSTAQLRALRLVLNRLSEDSLWDREALRLEFSEILQLEADIDLQITGFEVGEIDVALGGDTECEEDDCSDLDLTGKPISRFGDLWALGDHRLLCADARAPESYARLFGDNRAEMVFTDPPYNQRVDDISGLGAVKHAEFAMASGEMCSQEFEAFLSNTLSLAAEISTNGSLHFVFMDWRHLKELIKASSAIYSETKNLVVWAKCNGGMGSLYRSQHELLFVFKKGNAPHINNIELGRFGRHRSNVWTYPGQNELGARKSKLSLHPTAKPVSLVADALRDCSNRGGLILDPFGGIATTAIAAEKTGRRAYLIEIEPRFVDIAIRRWEQLTGKSAVKLEAGPAISSDRTEVADDRR
jgi:DNA modification methylase